MPLIAVAVAVVADVAVGAAGFGAVLAGTASLATTFAAIGAVGATISAIGSVTGVKELQTAGMVIGGIGGIGSLANAVGAFGSSATIGSVFGDANVAADVASNPASALDTAGLINDSGINSTAIDTATGAVSSSDILSTANALGSANTTGDSLANGIKANTLLTPPDSLVGAPTPESPSGSPTDAASLAKAGTTPTNISTTDQNWLKTQYPNPLDGTLAKAPGGQSYTYSATDGWAPQVASGIGGFLGSQSGGLIGMGVVQAAGSFLSGAFDPLKPAQVAAYQAQANANNASAALTNKQVGNMGQPIPVAQRLAVTGKAGMINSTPQGAAAA